MCAGVTCTQAICLLSSIANLIKLSLPFCDVSQCMIAGCSTFQPLQYNFIGLHQLHIYHATENSKHDLCGVWECNVWV